MCLSPHILGVFARKARISMVSSGLLAIFVGQMKNKTNIGVKTLALLMIAVMALLTFNQSSNIHSHRLSDGSVVFHAHPYNKTSDSSPIKKHHHNIRDFLIIQHISLLFLSLIAAFTTLLAVHHFTFKRDSYHKDKEELSYAFSGRAPPRF